MKLPIFFQTTLLLVLQVVVAQEDETTLEINHSNENFETIFYESSFDISLIDSNIPVNVLRYYSSGNIRDVLIRGSGLTLFLKKKCEDQESFDESIQYNINITESNLLSINVDVNETLEMNNLNPSTFSFHRKQPIRYMFVNPMTLIKSFLCDIFFWRKFSMTLMKSFLCDIFFWFDSSEDRGKAKYSKDHKVITQKSMEKCTVTAEILYPACDIDLTVTSPSVHVYNYTLETDPSNEENMCIHESSGQLTYSGNVFIVNASEIPITLSMFECFFSSDGRPFLNSKGNIIQANLSSDKEVWSLHSNDKQKISEDDCNGDTFDCDEQGSVWSNRALGEHASIASFASFTISLMTNNAPPDLIADALKAALDEVQHASISFDMASLLTQRPMSPGHLPPTSLEYTKDLESLALATAREGCVDETVSSLIAAAEVQEMEEDNDNTITVTGSIKNNLVIISKDEARHSALAWKTIKWICQEDNQLCIKVLDYMKTSGLTRAMASVRSSNLKEDSKLTVGTEWNRILYAMESIIKGFDTDSVKSTGVLHKTFIAEVSQDIIDNVVSVASSSNTSEE